jgi:phosphate transport system protein
MARRGLDGGHVTRTVDPDLEELRRLVGRMGAAARAILAKALRAAFDGDAAAAREVHRDDLEIDRLDVEIDEQVLTLLATQAPVARDLREVLALKGIAMDLERVGDLARNVARSGERLAEGSRAGVPVPAELRSLGAQAAALFDDALACLAALDTVRARAVLAGDDRIDRDEGEVIRRALAAIQERPQSSSQEVDFIFIARNLERVADHATNIAEDVLLVAEARNVKHAAKLGR